MTRHLLIGLLPNTAQNDVIFPILVAASFSILVYTMTVLGAIQFLMDRVRRSTGSRVSCGRGQCVVRLTTLVWARLASVTSDLSYLRWG